MKEEKPKVEVEIEEIERKGSKFKSLFLRFGLFLSSISISIILFEVCLRLFTPMPENLAKLKSSSLFLHENKPGAAFNRNSSEFDIDVKMNSSGFRDGEFSVGKKEEVFRIAILGDSQEEALQVELEETWQKVLERKLEESHGRDIETYNFGISGYGTDQQWLTLREKVWQFSPDLVILAVSPNDVGDTYKNKLVYLDNGNLEVTSTSERIGGNRIGKIVREAYIYHLLARASTTSDLTKKAFDSFRVKILGFAAAEKFFLSDAQLVQGPFEVIASQKNPPPEVVETWKVVSALIFDMREQSDAHGAKFMATINIPRAQVDTSDWEALKAQYSLDPNSSSPHEINTKLAEVCESFGITLYDPREDAIAWTVQNGIIHFPADGHYNVNGNRFMGEKVAEFLVAKEIIN